MPASTPETLSALRRERDRSMAAYISANRRAQELEAALRDAGRTADRQSIEAVDRIRRQIAQAGEEAKAARDRHSRLSDQAIAGLGQWLAQTPQELVERLPDRDPFLLFPVRLETKFARTGNGAAELRVRIWPDDIGIALPGGDLTPAEVTAGKQYWNARAIFATTPPGTPQADEARKNYEGAWETIAQLSGSYRAGWVVRQTKPNWDDTKNAPAAMPLVFPLPQDSVEPRIARAEVLPDRFVIVGTFNDQVFPDVVGALVAHSHRQNDFSPRNPAAFDENGSVVHRRPLKDRLDNLSGDLGIHSYPTLYEFVNRILTRQNNESTGVR